MSSISTDFPLPGVRPVDSNSSLSLSPSLSSGIPLRYERILSAPRISDRRMLPLDPTRMFTYPRPDPRQPPRARPTRGGRLRARGARTDSTTSRKISFFRYLIPSLRQDTTPVTAGGGFAIP